MFFYGEKLHRGPGVPSKKEMLALRREDVRAQGGTWKVRSGGRRGAQRARRREKLAQEAEQPAEETEGLRPAAHDARALLSRPE